MLGDNGAARAFLSWLPLKDILVVQGVNCMFNECIRQSTTIQQLLFLLDVPPIE